MAHFAELDSNNKVLRVVVIDNNEVGENGSLRGEQYCQNLFKGGTWKQTSYNTFEGKHYNADGSESADQSKAFRKNYAGVGYIYDVNRDAFIPEIVNHSSWTFNEFKCVYEPPFRPITFNLVKDENDNPLILKQSWNEDLGTWTGVLENGTQYNWNNTNQSWELA